MSVFLRPRQPADPLLRLFGFHHAGGSATAYYRFIQQLPQSWEALFLDLPGRGRRYREPLLTRLDDVVDEAVAAVQPWLDRPFAIFGHSMGAVVGFEVAHRLQAAGHDPVWVGISGRVPRYPEVLTHLAEADDDEMIDWMIGMGGTPGVIRDTPELAERAVRVLRADLRCLLNYEPGAGRQPLRCPVGVFGAEEDLLAPAEQLDSWGVYTTSLFTATRYPGHHLSLIGTQQAEYVAGIVASVRQSVVMA